MLARNDTRRGWKWWLAGTALAALSVPLQEYVARRYYRQTEGPPDFLETAERTAWTPVWREGRVPAEWLALRRSPVYRGDGVPRGDGAPVVLVQGFLTKGTYLAEMRAWLERLGYQARVANIGWNAGCIEVLGNALRDDIRRDSRPVHLVGHSLGGIIARAVAARDPARVASVATLSSPFRGLRVHPSLRLAATIVRSSIHARRTVPEGCFTLACECETVRAARTPLPETLRQLAVTTRDDGFVDWRYCTGPATRAVYVDASHVGLAFNAGVYEALAWHLDAAEREHARR
jgi:pimeloyl-ACP methyl ester carboxylesterase